MELILKQTINALGQEGDIVKVKPGYGRNFLLPKGKAVLADAKNKTILAKNRASIEATIEQERKNAENLAKKIAGIKIKISQLAGEDDRLFGSVTSADICQKLADLNIEIDKKNILLAEPIKTVGESTVPVKVGFHLVTDIKVIVSALEETE